jgi:eukaryotic-like serine/threonine-protein kinase
MSHLADAEIFGNTSRNSSDPSPDSAPAGPGPSPHSLAPAMPYRAKESPAPEQSFALNARTIVGVAAPSACRAIGNYWSFAQIASGGMATVHVGYGFHAGKRKTIAIKLLKPAYVEDHEFASMFTSEARLAARIQHPNVVQTLDFVKDDGELALVMDYIPGEALSKLLVAGYREQNPATPPMLRRILADVLRGLHAAHEARDADGSKAHIVHRDVSPQNILVGVDGVARVLDFGIAQAAGRVSFTRDNEVRGKLSYVAPEQLEDTKVDHRADIYAASVVLWEALTCKRLFQTDDEATTLARVLNLRVPPPSYYNKRVGSDLDAVVLKGLDRNRDLRYQSAWDMARAVAASGPCATRDEVAEWVNGVAAQKLAERQRLVAAMHGAAIDQPSEYGIRGDGGHYAVPPATRSSVSIDDVDVATSSSEIGLDAAIASESFGPENSFADLPMVSDAHLVAPSSALRLRRRIKHTLVAAATLFGGAVLGTLLVLQGANFLEPTAGIKSLATLEVRPALGDQPDPTPAVEIPAALGPEGLVAKPLPSTGGVEPAKMDSARAAQDNAPQQGGQLQQPPSATEKPPLVPAVFNGGARAAALAVAGAGGASENIRQTADNPARTPGKAERVGQTGPSVVAPSEAASSNTARSSAARSPNTDIATSDAKPATQTPTTAYQTPATANCTPPYSIDASGIRRYKLECL